jgi:hypothetical protein
MRSVEVRGASFAFMAAVMSETILFFRLMDSLAPSL